MKKAKFSGRVKNKKTGEIGRILYPKFEPTLDQFQNGSEEKTEYAVEVTWLGKDLEQL